MHGSRPDEWFGFSIAGFKVLHDSRDQGWDALEDAAANPLLGDFSKPAFHQVQPRRRGRGEVHVETRVLGQHTAEICRDLLKMAESQISQLKEEGVLEVSSRQARN